MRTTLKLVTFISAGFLMTACQPEKPTPPDMGSTYTMPNATSGKGVYQVIMDGKKKRMMYAPTSLDILSEDSWGCCCDADTPKEAAIVRTNRSLELRVGDLTPRISIEDVSVSCSSDNPAMIEVVFDLKAEHSGGSNGLPIVEVPLFFSSADIPSNEVFSHGHAMAKVDLNKPYEIQRVRAFFDTSDLKARGLTGWSLLVGIMKSEQNRKFEAEVAREDEQHIAEAAGPDINKNRVGNLAPSVRGSDDAPKPEALITK